jgi:glycosyltransferase involved in cell wall biosynthesis
MNRRRYLIGQLDQADYVVFPSKAIAEIVASRLAHRRWHVVPNGLTPVWFENPRAARTEVKAPKFLTLGFSGTLAEHKAPHLLLEAMRLLGWTRTRVRVAGTATDAAYEERLRQAAEGLNVEFVGRLSAEQMPAFQRTLDILAMTSVWPENCPYAVLEAQAAGVIVVGSRAGGVVEMIGDERLLFEPGSVRGLAAAIEFGRCDPGAGRSARVATAQEMADAIEGIYEQTVRREVT